jgi:hypothetical protein
MEDKTLQALTEQIAAAECDGQALTKCANHLADLSGRLAELANAMATQASSMIHNARTANFALRSLTHPPAVPDTNV